MATLRPVAGVGPLCSKRRHAHDKRSSPTPIYCCLYCLFGFWLHNALALALAAVLICMVQQTHLLITNDDCPLRMFQAHRLHRCALLQTLCSGSLLVHSQRNVCICAMAEPWRTNASYYAAGSWKLLQRMHSAARSSTGSLRCDESVDV